MAAAAFCAADAFLLSASLDSFFCKEAVGIAAGSGSTLDGVEKVAVKEGVAGEASAAEVCDRGRDAAVSSGVSTASVDVVVAVVTFSASVDDDDAVDDAGGGGGGGDGADDAGNDSSRLCFAGIKKDADALSLRFKVTFCSCSG